MKISTKILIIALIFIVTLGYSFFEKKNLESYLKTENLLILKKLPKFSVDDSYSSSKLTSELMLKNKKLIIVHFWGSWCGPCLTEFPEMLDLAEKYEDKDIIFYLISVNDTKIAMNKFLKRFKDKMPKNTVISLDKSGMMLELFGTNKVPETFIFTKDGITLRKFVGPQPWSNKGISDQLDTYLK